MSKLEAKEVREGGEYIGKEIWICDFRWEDFDKKESRNIKPTKVLIRDISETYKRVYYSNVFFSEIKKDKVINSSIIKIFDNTGYRTYAGVALNMFTTEKECLSKYEKQKKEVLEKFYTYKIAKIKDIESIEYKIKS